jgi:photosystem II stability/assembly factor-like uncharacterized protein
VDFATPDVGWIAGEMGDAARTTDGGTWWSPVTITHDELGIGPPDAVNPIAATDATHAWALARWADTSLLYHSSDSGVSWPRVTYTDHGYTSPDTVYGMDFISDSVVWLAATRYNGTAYIPVMLETTNGGATWAAYDAPVTSLNSTSSPAWVVTVQASSATLAWVHVWDTVHSIGVLFQIAQSPSTGTWGWKTWTWNNRVNTIAFSTALSGILVGDATWQTRDGLQTITSAANPAAAGLVAGFSSLYRGFAAGQDGNLYRWTDDNAGDANVDGRVDVSDACLIAALAAGRSKPAAVNADLADADGNGQITYLDAAIALRRAGGLSQ